MRMIVSIAGVWNSSKSEERINATSWIEDIFFSFFKLWLYTPYFYQVKNMLTDNITILLTFSNTQDLHYIFCDAPKLTTA